MKKTTISLNEFAGLCNLTPRYLRQLAERGVLPRITRSRIERDDAIKRLIGHYQKTSEEMVQERLALTRANREQKEFDLELSRGRWMPRAEAEQAIRGAIRTHHSFTRTALELTGPQRRREKLMELGAPDGIVQPFNAFDIADSENVIGRIEARCAKAADADLPAETEAAQ